MKLSFLAPLSVAVLAAGLTIAAPAIAQVVTNEDAPPKPAQTETDDPESDGNAVAESEPNQSAESEDGASTQNGEVLSNADRPNKQQQNEQQRSQSEPEGRQESDRQRESDADDQDAIPSDDLELNDQQRRDQDVNRDDREQNNNRQTQNLDRANQQNRPDRINVESTDDLGLQVNEADNGLAITSIERNSVLMQSGFRQGDVIVSVQQRPVRSSADFISWFGRLDRQARLPVIVLRDNRRETIYLTGSQVWQWYERDYAQGDDSDRQDYGQAAYLGVVFDDRYPRLAMVEVVRRNTTAARAGLRPGDVISRINGQRVNGLRHASQMVAQLNPGDEIELEYSRRTTARANAVLGSRPDGRQTAYSDDDDASEYDNPSYDNAEQTRYDGEDRDGAVRTNYEAQNSQGRNGAERDGLLRRGDGRPFRNP